MRYTFAPLEGVTGYVYRNLHRRWFGGVERYYMPFISVGQSRSFSPREWQDFCPEHNESGDLVPQLLGRTPRVLSGRPGSCARWGTVRSISTWDALPAP